MNINELLIQYSNEIIAEADTSLMRSHVKNYEKAGAVQTERRLKALYVLVAHAIKEKNLGPIIAHAEKIAEDRFVAGFDLWEVQTAFNVLEEAIWKRILKEVSPAEMGEALGFVSTVLGAGKDALARTYVSLASRTKAPSMDFESMFSGTAG